MEIGQAQAPAVDPPGDVMIDSGPADRHSPPPAHLSPEKGESLAPSGKGTPLALQLSLPASNCERRGLPMLACQFVIYLEES